MEEHPDKIRVAYVYSVIPCGKKGLRFLPVTVYNVGMIRMSSLLLALALGSLHPLHAEPAPATVNTAQLEQQLLDVLRAMVKTGSEDFYDAAVLVLNATGDESAFLPMMKKAAAAGSSSAQYWVAMSLLPTAMPGSADYAEMERMLDKAVSGKYSPALIMAARVKAETDAQASLRYLMEACRYGNAKARALYLLQSGRIQAGNLSLPEVASELKKNNYYLEEIIANMQTTDAQALEWLRKADAHGSVTAPYVFSQSLLPDETDADRLNHLRRAAERHNVMAMFLYGSVLLRGEAVYEGVKKDPAEALRLMQLASMLGSPDAAAQLAVLFSTGELEGATPARIYNLFEHAHRCGLVEGSAGVGLCKLLGSGCPRDTEAGLAMMLKARDAGARWVNQVLASIYFNGCEGVKPDMRRALDYLTDDAIAGGVYSYAIAAGISRLGNDGTPSDASMSDYYLQNALQNAADPAAVQKVYDAIIISKSWQSMPVLENTPSAAEK